MSIIIWALIIFQVILTILLIRILIYLSKWVFARPQPLPFIPTSHSVLHSIIESGVLEDKDTIMDLGSGSGTILAYLGKVFPEAKLVGVERSRELVWASRFRFLFWNNRPKIVRGDMFNHSVKDADAIVGFWIGHLMPMLLRKFEKECKPGCVIVSNRFSLPDSDHFESKTIPNEKNKIYLYVKK